MMMLSRRQVGALLLGSGITGLCLGESPRAHGGPPIHKVTIRKFRFSPANLTVRQNDSVTFLNQDIAPHTATDDVPRWDTGKLMKGGTSQVTFTNVGTYRYHCAYHPGMTAKIIVSAK